MATFEYIALDKSGRRTGGILSGPSEQAVLAELESRRLTPVSIEARDDSIARGGGVSARKLGAAYTQLAELLDAGVPLLRSIKILGAKKSEPRLAAVFQEIAEAVSEGSDLASAMQRRPEFFPPVHIAMVRAGEKGGFLENVLQRLAQLATSQAELRSKVMGSLIYPMFLLGTGVIVLAVIFGVFVPKFREVFDRVQGGLPWVTSLVLAISKLVSTYGFYTLGAAILIGVVLWRIARREGVRDKFARWWTFAPVVGNLVRSLAAARFCRMLGTMLTNGVPLLTAMNIAREAAGNPVVEEAIVTAAESVKQGKSLAPPLDSCGLFETDVVEMISVAEAANNLDQVLLKIADTIEGRVDRLLAAVLKLVEPILLLALAAVVATVAFALILPMTRVSAAL
ncbi:MAG: type II secretion system F family protein [Phycisphaerales bacterium]|nr:type II secretion system F family protein [Phycisphaerales bacterium]